MKLWLCTGKCVLNSLLQHKNIFISLFSKAGSPNNINNTLQSTYIYDYVLTHKNNNLLILIWHDKHKGLERDSRLLWRNSYWRATNLIFNFGLPKIRHFLILEKNEIYFFVGVGET